MQLVLQGHAGDAPTLCEASLTKKGLVELCGLDPHLMFRAHCFPLCVCVCTEVSNCPPHHPHGAVSPIITNCFSEVFLGIAVM